MEKPSQTLDPAPAGRCEEDARFGVNLHFPAPGRIWIALILGLVGLGLLAYALVWQLQRRMVAEALEEQGLAVERHLEGLIRRFADTEGDLEALGARLVAAAEGAPAVIDLVVTDPERHVVARFSRRPGNRLGCLAKVPPDAAAHHEHPAGAIAPTPVACTSLPVRVGGEQRGLVLFHAARDWKADGPRVGRWVHRTALWLAPVFLGFYLLLGVVLVAAARSARRWRARAESAARVEALGMIAAGISHEIKNPLNTVGLSLQYLARRHDDEETREVVASAEREAKRIGRTLDEFARFTRVSRLDTVTVDLGARLRERFGGAIAVAGEARAQVDTKQMDDAFGAIGALLSRGERPAITLSASGGAWKFAARARMPDLDAAAAGRLLDPYLRTGKQDVGRGLALARAIFQAHGGDLTVQFKAGRLTLRGGAPCVPPGEEPS